MKVWIPPYNNRVHVQPASVKAFWHIENLSYNCKQPPVLLISDSVTKQKCRHRIRKTACLVYVIYMQFLRWWLWLITLIKCWILRESPLFSLSCVMVLTKLSPHVAHDRTLCVQDFARVSMFCLSLCCSWHILTQHLLCDGPITWTNTSGAGATAKVLNWCYFIHSQYQWDISISWQAMTQTNKIYTRFQWCQA